jgi:hypothetical protein
LRAVFRENDVIDMRGRNGWALGTAIVTKVYPDRLVVANIMGGTATVPVEACRVTRWGTREYCFARMMEHLRESEIHQARYRKGLAENRSDGKEDYLFQTSTIGKGIVSDQQFAGREVGVYAMALAGLAAHSQRGADMAPEVDLLRRIFDTQDRLVSTEGGGEDGDL